MCVDGPQFLSLGIAQVSAAAAEARALTDQRPEFWADSVFWAVRHRGSAAFLAASCHLTRAHCLARVAWLLRPPPSPAEAATIRLVLQALSAAPASFACTPPTMPAGGTGSNGDTGDVADQHLSPEAASSGKLLCTALASALQSLIAVVVPDPVERAQAPTASTNAPAEWRLRLPGACLVEELLQRCSLSAGDVLRDVMRHLHCHVAALGGGEEQVRRDWEALCSTLREDLFTPVEHTARNLEDALSWCRRPHCARAFLSCTPAQEEMAAAALASTISRLGSVQVPQSDPLAGHLCRAQGGARGSMGFVLQRWQQRMGRGLDGGTMAALWRAVVPAPLPSPRCVGVLQARVKAGVVVSGAECLSLGPSPQSDESWAEDVLLDYLCTQMFCGGGGHTPFMKTWGAGLAYSSGVSCAATTGVMRYYADHCPDVGRTMQFAAGEIRALAKMGTPAEPSTAPSLGVDLAEYALAQCFGGQDSVASPEMRVEALAARLADGQGPDREKALRSELLKLRCCGALQDMLQERVLRVMGSVLPSVAHEERPGEARAPRDWSPVRGQSVHRNGLCMVIGDDQQLAAQGRYVAECGLHPHEIAQLLERDFWVVGGDCCVSKAFLPSNKWAWCTVGLVVLGTIGIMAVRYNHGKK